MTPEDYNFSSSTAQVKQGMRLKAALTCLGNGAEANVIFYDVVNNALGLVSNRSRIEDREV